MERTIKNRCFLVFTVRWSFPTFSPLRSGAASTVGIDKTCTMHWAHHVKAPKKVGKTLILAETCHLVYSRDYYRGKVSIKIVIYYIDGKPLLAPWAAWLGAVVLYQTQRLIVLQPR